jgi:hypothetical protein
MWALMNDFLIGSFHVHMFWCKTHIDFLLLIQKSCEASSMLLAEKELKKREKF